MSTSLNDAQRKLVEDNHNLIYSFLKSRNLSLNAAQDWYGTAAAGLCKAAMAYDERKGAKFATLAYICMDNEVRQVMRKEERSAKAQVSLDVDIGNEECLRLGDVIPDVADPFFSVCLNDAVETAMRGMSDRDKAIVGLVVHTDLTQSQIGTKYGVSHPTVSRIYNRFISKVREYLND